MRSERVVVVVMLSFFGACGVSPAAADAGVDAGTAEDAGVACEGPAGDARSMHVQPPDGAANPFDLWAITLAPDAGDALDGGSQCVVPPTPGGAAPPFAFIACEGRGVVSLDGGLAIVLDDGATLAWSGAAPYAPPAVRDGEVLSLEVRRTATFNYNGWTRTQRVALRTAEGKDRWLGAAAPLVGAADVFGVNAQAERVCWRNAVCNGADAWRGYRLGHVLGTSPAQTIPPGGVTEVTTPTGRWQVSWWGTEATWLTSSTECGADLPSQPRGGYVISRVGE